MQKKFNPDRSLDNQDNQKVGEETRRGFFKRFVPEPDSSPERKYYSAETRDNPLGKFVSRRTLLKAGAAFLTVQALEKFQRLAAHDRKVFAEQNEEKFTDEQCEAFFQWCHDRISDLDKRGERKSDDLILDLADFSVEVAVSLQALSARQTKKFTLDTDWVYSKLDDLRTDADWDIDPESDLREIEVPPNLLKLKTFGRFVSAETAPEKPKQMKLSLLYFGDSHEWDPSDAHFPNTITAHEEMYQMFSLLLQDSYRVVGFEQEDDVESMRQRLEGQIKGIEGVLKAFGRGWGETTKKRFAARIGKLKNIIDHDASFKIHSRYPAVEVLGIDTYAKDNRLDHNAQGAKRVALAREYGRAKANYYNVRRGLEQGDLAIAARAVIATERALSDIEKQMYYERSKHACRQMIAQMLVARLTKGVIIFGMADAKYFREQVRLINEDPAEYLALLQKDNEMLYNELIKQFAPEDLKALAVDLYTIIPNGFLPE